MPTPTPNPAAESPSSVMMNLDPAPACNPFRFGGNIDAKPSPTPKAEPQKSTFRLRPFAAEIADANGK
jgi:hypothetical protein